MKKITGRLSCVASMMPACMLSACLLAVCMLAACMLFAGCGASGQAEGGSPDSAKQSESASVQNEGSGEYSYQKQDITVAALKGPTAIGMVQMMKNAGEGGADNNYTFKVAGTADEFTADLIKGEVQIAALPCNAAATLYNKSGGKIKVMGINTLGVLYILDTGSSVNSIQDLKGKTIYSTGMGTTPEYTLRYLLNSAGIDADRDVNIEFKSEASEVAAIMASSSDEVIAMLPQPYVTTVTMQNPDVRIALDVTKEWEKLAGSDSTVVTGVIAVNAEFADKNPEAVQKFMDEYGRSVTYVNSNVKEAAQLVEKFDIFKAAVAEKAIPYCNITFITGNEMKDKISRYLTVLNDANPSSIGGAMPGDDFYYGAQ